MPAINASLFFYHIQIGVIMIDGDAVWHIEIRVRLLLFFHTELAYSSICKQDKWVGFQTAKRNTVLAGQRVVR